MDLKQMLIEKGASKAQLDSQVVKMVEDSIAEDQGMIPEAARARADEIDMKINRAGASIKALESNISNAKWELHNERLNLKFYVMADS